MSAITVRLFGPAREAVGAATATVDAGPRPTAADVVAALERLHPELAGLLPRSRVAVNLSYVEASTVLSPGDEVAVLPPVGGG